MGFWTVFAIVLSAASFTASYVQAKKAQKKAKRLADEMAGVLVNKESNIEAIPVVYGERRVGGVRVFMSTSGDDRHEYLYVALVVAEGEVEQISDLEIDEVPATDSRFQGLVSYHYKLGTDDQTTSSILDDALVTVDDNDPNWEYQGVVVTNQAFVNNFRLRGVAYVAIRLKYDAEVFNGVPDFTVKVKGRKVYDPRKDSTSTHYDSSLGVSTHREATTSTWEWTDNPALCLRDYLTNERFGKGLDATDLDDGEFVQAADDLDSFTVTPYSGASSGHKLFRLNAVIDTNEEIFTNVEKILLSCRGFLPYTFGKYGLKIDQASTSVMTLDTSTIIGDINIVGSRKEDRFNQVIVKFPDANTRFQPNNAVWPNQSSTNPTLVSDGGSGYLTEAELHDEFLADDDELLVDEVDLEYCTDYYAARDLARIFLWRSRTAINVALQATSEAMELTVGDVVSITHPTPNWTAKKFQVDEMSINYDGTVTLKCVEYDNTIYTYDPSAEEIEAIDIIRGDPGNVQPPTNVSGNNTGSTVLDDGAFHAVLNVSWTASPDATVIEYQVRYKLSTDSAYKYLNTTDTSVRIEGMTPGLYNIAVRALDFAGGKSAFVTGTNVDTGVDTSIPGNITNLSFTSGVRAITVEWSNPTDADYAFTEIHVKTSNDQPDSGDAPTAKVAGEEYVYPTAAGVVQRYFFLRAVDRTGNKGSFTGTTGNLGASLQATGDDIGTGEVGTGEIEDDAVTIDKIANTLESTNYVAGTSGWRLTTAGDFEAGDGDFRGTVKATVLDVEDANVHGTLTATNIAAGIVTADTLAADVFAEFDDRYGGSGGFYRADNDEFFDGSATKYVTLPTVTHDNSKSIRLQCNLVHAWGTTSGYGGTNGLKLRVTFEYSTDDTTYAKVPGSGENSNDYYERSATATIYSVTSAFDLAVDIRYEMTGSSLSDNTAYYFRVKIEYVSATNAFTSAAAGSANGVPIKFNVQQTSGLTASTGDADTVDGLQASQFLRSDTSDTFSGNLTVTGNLTVQGSQTQLDTQTLTVEDNNIVLNYSTGDSSGSADNAGFTIQDAVNSTTDASLLWKATGDYFQFSHPINAISSASNAYAAEFRGAPQPQGPSGMVSNGVKITAGSSSTDTVLLVQELDNTAILTINGFGQTTFANSVTIDGQSVTGTKIGQWNTAYGWGDHASAGYSDEYKNYSIASGANHDTHHWNKTHAAYSNNSSSPSYIVLTTNVPQDNYSMGGFTLILQNHYSDNDEGDVVNVYGYWNPESNGGFVGFRYHTSNPDCAPTIQVGRNSSGNTVFLISGESGSYAQVIAKDLWLGYSANNASASWGDSWAFSEASATTGISNLNTLTRVGITAAQRTNWNTAYTYSQVGHLPLVGGTLSGGIRFRNDTTGDNTIIEDIDWVTSAAPDTDDRIALVRAQTSGGTNTTRGGKLYFYTRNPSGAFNSAVLGNDGTFTVTNLVSTGGVTSNGGTSTFNDVNVGGGSSSAAQIDIIATNTSNQPAMTNTLRMQGHGSRGQGILFENVSYSGEEWFAGLNYGGNFNTYSIGYDATGGQAEYMANALFTVTSSGSLQVSGNDFIDSSRNITATSATASGAIQGQTVIAKGGTSTYSVSTVTLENNFDTAHLKSSYTDPALTTETYLAFHTNKAGITNGTVSESMRLSGDNLSVNGEVSSDGFAIGTDTIIGSNTRITAGDGTTVKAGIGFLGSSTTGLSYSSSRDRVSILSGGTVRAYIQTPSTNPIADAFYVDGTSSFNGKISVTGHGNSSQWNTAYGWGDHSTAGYPHIQSSAYNGVYNIPIHATGDLYTTPSAGNVTITGSTGQISTPNHGDSSEWNTAYGWGDHSTAGYLTAEADTLSTVTARGSTSATSIGIVNSAPTITLRDNNSTGSAQVGYISFQDSSTAERAWVGYGSSNDSVFTIRNQLNYILAYGSYFRSEGYITTPYYRAENSGTNGAPAYSFASDTDTGMYQVASNELGFSVGGRDVLRLGYTYIAQPERTFTHPASAPGWYKIAKIDSRGGGRIIISYTGGNYTPNTYIIDYFKNWSSHASLKLNQFGLNSFITNVRIRQDSSDSKYYLEIYLSNESVAQAIFIYDQRLLGYNATTTLYTGTLSAGSSSGTTVAEEIFTHSGVTTSRMTVADHLGVGTQANTSYALYAGGDIAQSSGSITAFGNVTAGNGYVKASSQSGGGYWVDSTQVIDTNGAFIGGRVNINVGTSSNAIAVTGSSSTQTDIRIANTSTGDAILWFDASNGDFIGSDYASIRQTNSLALELGTQPSGGQITFKPADSLALTLNTDQTATFEKSIVVKTPNGYSTDGGRLISSYYSNNDVLAVISQDRSSGSLTFGYGAESSTTASQQFVSTFDNFSGNRSAMQLRNNRLELWGTNGGVQTTVGDQLTTMTNRITLNTDTGNIVTTGAVTLGNNIVFSGISQNAYVGIIPETDQNLMLGTGSGAEPRIYLKGGGNGQADAGDVFIGAGTGGVIRLNNVVSIPSTSYFTGNTSYGYRFNDAADSVNLVIIDNTGNFSVLRGTSTIVSDAGTDVVESIRNPSLSWGEYALTRYGTEGANFRYMDFGYYRGTNEATRGLVMRSQAGTTLHHFYDDATVEFGGDVIAQKANAMFHARSSADSQTVGFRAGYQNHATLQGFFRYTTGDAQLYIDNDFTGNNDLYSNINFRNKANNGTSLINRMTIHGSTGHVNIRGGDLQMQGTSLVDSSRNVTANTVTAQGASGGFFYAEDTTAGTATDELIGGFLFKNNDTSGTAPHYAGMTARTTNIYGAMALEFFADRADYENDTPAMRLYSDGTDSGTNTLDLQNITSIAGTGSIGSGAITSSGRSTFDAVTITDDGEGSPTLLIQTDDNQPWAFQITNDSATDGGLFQTYVNNNSDVYFRVTKTNSYADWYFQVYDAQNVVTAMRLDENGIYSSLTADLGEIEIGGVTTVSSQRRFYASTGTNAKAAYSFDGESNTGWYKPAAGEIAFIGQGTEHLKIKSTGELEIPDGRINVDNDGTSFDALLLGSSTQTQYTNSMWFSNSGQGQIWKAGSLYTLWGGTSAFNIYNSNGVIALHPSGTANVLVATSTSVYTGQSLGVGLSSWDTTNIALEVNGHASIRRGHELYFGINSTTINSWQTRLRNSGSTVIIDGQALQFTNTGYGTSTFFTSDSSGMNIQTGDLLMNGTAIIKSDGNAYFPSSYRLNENYIERRINTPYFTNGTSNLAVDITLGNVSQNTVLEILVTGGYSFANTSGLIRRRWNFGANPNNSVWQSPTIIDETIEGPIANHLFVSDPFWDSSASTYKIRIYKKDSSGNAYHCLIRNFSVNAADDLESNLSMGSLLTNTSTTSSHSAGTNAGSGYRVAGNAFVDSSRNVTVGSTVYFGGANNQSYISGATNLSFNADGYSSFGTYDGGWQERARITDAGLSVYGGLDVTGNNLNLRRNNNGDGNIIRDLNWLNSFAQGTDDRLALIRVQNQGGAADSRGGTMVFFTRQSGSSGFNTAMTIDNQGYIGMSASPSSSARLYVGGDIRTTGIKHDNSGDLVIDLNNDTYTIINNPDGTESIKIGGGGGTDAQNTYKNDIHRFYKADGSTDLGRLYQGVADFFSSTIYGGSVDVSGDGSFGGSTQSTQLTIEATDTAGAPATTTSIMMRGYESRAQGTFFENVSYSGKEWFAGMQYGGSHEMYQIGYDASGGQSEYGANRIAGFYSTGAWYHGNDVLVDSSRSIKPVSVDNGYGTNIKPSYSFEGDSNTGFYRSAADEMTFLNGGSSSLVLRSDQSVRASSYFRSEESISVDNEAVIHAAHFAAAGSSQSGAILIQLPGNRSTNWSMAVFRITTYEYSADAHNIYYVSGHDWTSGWYNVGCTHHGLNAESVKLINNSGTNKQAILIGATGTSRSYLHVSVDIIAAPSFYTSNMDWQGNWSITLDNSLSGWDHTSQSNICSTALLSYAGNRNFEVGSSGRLYFGGNSYLSYNGADEIRHETSHGYIRFGPFNTSGAHIYTDRDRFYFNSKISLINGHLTSYNGDLVLSRSENAAHRLTLSTTGITATGNVTAYSDERLKENIETLDGSKVYDMRGVSFTKDGHDGSGVIAQELEKVAPELVQDGEYKSVAYGNLVGYLIEAVKDQKALIDNLTQRIEELENGNNTND